MPDISDEPFQLLGEIQNLGRVMRRCSSVHDPEFIAAQTALARAINRLASLSTIRDRSLPGGGGIEV